MTFKPESFAAVPVNRLFGFQLLDRDDTSATVRFTPNSDHAQEYGVVHGGILAALADTSAVYTVHPGLSEPERMTSVEFKVNFLAAALVGRGDITSRAAIVRRGKSIAVVRADVFQGDTHVVTGLFTYIISSVAAPG